MKRIFQKPSTTPTASGVFAAADARSILASVKQLGTGRVICNRGALSLAISTDFRAMRAMGYGLVFPGGVLELTPAKLQVIVSTASCGLGLGISLLDQKNNLLLVFHFCHGSPWGKWLENYTQSGLLQPHPEPHLATADLCWCEVWPQQKAQTVAMPGSLLEKRFNTLTNSRTIETTLRSPEFELSAVVHPASFDILSSSVRFWDRPRTRVCYADLSCIAPEQHETYIALNDRGVSAN